MFLICEIAQYVQALELEKEHTYSFETQCSARSWEIQ